MSSGEQPTGPATATEPKRTRASNPATWGLIGVLCGSLISGVFSFVSARMAYDASESAATKAQQTSERALEAQRNQAKDEFVRSQRVTVYGKYLTASQWSGIAMDDLLTVIQNPLHSPETREFWRSNFELKYREFVDASWGLEFFAPEELRAVAHQLNAELAARHDLLLAHYSSASGPDQLADVIARLRGPEDRVFQLRTTFTSVASSAVGS